MTKKRIEINGQRFSNLMEFYDEIENHFTQNLDWKIGRNLNALNDVLYGGFGVHDYDEPIEIIWKNSDKSKIDLGFTETVKYIENKLTTCHPSNRDDVREDLELAKQNKGKTLFEIITEIIQDHEHIKLKFD